MSSRFQFTHPGRGATASPVSTSSVSLSFNSRTPGGVRLGGLRLRTAVEPVSIHAPREGCDVEEERAECLVVVSIHAPREGCDCSSYVGAVHTSCFNSRTPGGVRRPGARIQRARIRKFQFTHPGRGATAPRKSPACSLIRFNSRTPGGVRQRCACRQSPTRSRFNSRTPGGVRPIRFALDVDDALFQFTHPGRGATIALPVVSAALVFQFTHPGRGATSTCS